MYGFEGGSRKALTPHPSTDGAKTNSGNGQKEEADGEKGDKGKHSGDGGQDIQGLNTCPMCRETHSERIPCIPSVASPAIPDLGVRSKAAWKTSIVWASLALGGLAKALLLVQNWA